MIRDDVISQKLQNYFSLPMSQIDDIITVNINSSLYSYKLEGQLGRYKSKKVAKRYFFPPLEAKIKFCTYERRQTMAV